MGKIKIAVIGVGYLGKFHAQKFKGMDNVELVGLVDIDSEAAGKVAKNLNTDFFTDYTELFTRVDAVSIAAPTPAHYAISKAFLQNGVDVFIEKPITTQLKEADELIQIAADNNLLIQVGHLERFNSAVLALEEIIKKPRFIESHRLSIYKPRCTDVSVVLDLMIHDIDIILNLVGSKIKSIHAAGIPVVSEHVDIANARVEFNNGCVANVTASRISEKNERKIRIFQPDAYLSVDFAEHKISVIRQDGANEKGLIPGMDIKHHSFKGGDALDDELRSFVEAVAKRKTPAVTGQMGRDALNLALNIMDQIKLTSQNY